MYTAMKCDMERMHQKNRSRSTTPWSPRSRTRTQFLRDPKENFYISELYKLHNRISYEDPENAEIDKVRLLLQLLTRGEVEPRFIVVTFWM